MKNFTLEEVYKFAKSLGYSREQVELSDTSWEDEDGSEIQLWAEFGTEYTEMWSWLFHDYNEPADEYEHLTWED